jgi:hypothetical protein
MNRKILRLFKKHYNLDAYHYWLRARLETRANPLFQKKSKKCFLLKINFFLYVLDRFDALISIILMHFSMKSTLKNNHNYTPKHAIRLRHRKPISYNNNKRYITSFI